MTNQEKAIQIAIDTFLSDYTATAIETYERLKNEVHADWNELDYCTVWLPFENEHIDDTLDSIDNLIESIVRQFTVYN